MKPQSLPNQEQRCPVCDNHVAQFFALKGQEESRVFWYFCRCGLLFNTEEVDYKEVFTKEYQENFKNMKNIDLRLDYQVRMYAPILEELTYGRRMLDVGFCHDVLINTMRKRGWLSTGIDLIEDNGHITGDFEDFDFEGERFDLIWMGDVIQSFKDPIKSIKKAYDLLRPDGLLFIVTPNTDLIRNDIIPAWGHWDMYAHRQFINRDILERSFQTAPDDLKGRMEIIYFYNNFSQRFHTWNTMHVIAQKKCIEDLKGFDEVKNDLEEAKKEK